MVSNLHDEEHYVLWAEVENQKSPESPSFLSRHIHSETYSEGRGTVMRRGVRGTVSR